MLHINDLKPFAVIFGIFFIDLKTYLGIVFFSIIIILLDSSADRVLNILFQMTHTWLRDLLITRYVIKVRTVSGIHWRTGVENSTFIINIVWSINLHPLPLYAIIKRYCVKIHVLTVRNGIQWSTLVRWNFI